MVSLLLFGGGFYIALMALVLVLSFIQRIVEKIQETLDNEHKP